MDEKIKAELDKIIAECTVGLKVNQYKHICFVGQGPNQTSWLKNIEKGKRYHRLGTHPDMSEKDYAESFAIQMGKRLALTGSVGNKLSELLWIDRLEFCAAFRRENLNQRWNGKSGKGDKFDTIEGCEKASELWDDQSIKKFVFLGKAVAYCFGNRLPDDQFVIPQERDGRHMMVLPHPSGINLWWNVKGNADLAGNALRNFCFA